MRKRHWSKFNFKEWRSSPELAQCSRAARSLWLDLCGLIYEAEDGGRLTLRKQPLDSRQLAAILGDDPRSITALLKELGRAGVYSVDPDGVAYCRRIRREMLSENISDIDPDVAPEVSKRPRRKFRKNKVVQNQSKTQNPEPEIEPLQGSISVPVSQNVVALRPRAEGRGTREPLMEKIDLAALTAERDSLERIAIRYPEAMTGDRSARLAELNEKLTELKSG